MQDVKDTIKDELDVSDEDIAKAMEVLGMTATDLLSVVKVTELGNSCRMSKSRF